MGIENSSWNATAMEKVEKSKELVLCSVIVDQIRLIRIYHIDVWQTTAISGPIKYRESK